MYFLLTATNKIFTSDTWAAYFGNTICVTHIPSDVVKFYSAVFIFNELLEKTRAIKFYNYAVNFSDKIPCTIWVPYFMLMNPQKIMVRAKFYRTVMARINDHCCKPAIFFTVIYTFKMYVTYFLPQHIVFIKCDYSFFETVRWYTSDLVLS